ncbi:hypothetical protein DM860_012952 [Cuscuta australis]|uniref:RNase H type-1 domain-containing protein n=1 Tax=Cuscuta australis TaxID=267555 RepID=A0A328DYT3_9ASTE|nr:hypothetical protein DM860_012952 [Cuscuta australis]
MEEKKKKMVMRRRRGGSVWIGERAGEEGGGGGSVKERRKRMEETREKVKEWKEWKRKKEKDKEEGVNRRREWKKKKRRKEEEEGSIGRMASRSGQVGQRFEERTGRATFGAVLLSHEGRFVAAMNGPLFDVLSPLMAETLACKETLVWLKARDTSNVRLFSDCSTLCHYLGSASTTSRTYIGIYFHECKVLLRTFTNCSVSFVPCSSNSLAHLLATMAYSQPQIMYWDSVPPFFPSLINHM